MEAIVFSSASCAPCKVYKEQTIEPLIKDGYNIAYVSIDDDEGQKMAMEYRVRAVPTTVLRKPNNDGKVEQVLVGMQSIEKMKGLMDA